MNEIIFSHKYLKLLNSDGLINNIKLLEVLEIYVENLSKEFIAYDIEENLYSLPKKGKFLMLIFEKQKGNIFTTLRSSNDDKKEFYRSKIGQIFKIKLSVK